MQTFLLQIISIQTIVYIRDQEFMEMSEDKQTLPPLTPEETASIHAEMNLLERRRALYHDRFRWSFFLGLFLLIVGTVLLSASQSFWYFAPAVVSLGAATAFYAVERGYHVAWGLLSIPGLALLNVLPDRNAERLDELDQRLTGKVTTRKSKEQLSQAFWLPVITAAAMAFAEERSRSPGPNGLIIAGIALAPVGLFHAIRLLLDAHINRKNVVLPVAVSVWAGFWTFVAAIMLHASLSR